MTTRGKIKTTVAFRLLNQRRRASTPEHAWGVFSVKANGEAYARPSSTHIDEATAVARAVEMAHMNPGRAFVAREVAS